MTTSKKLQNKLKQRDKKRHKPDMVVDNASVKRIQLDLQHKRRKKD